MCWNFQIKINLQAINSTMRTLIHVSPILKFMKTYTKNAVLTILQKKARASVRPLTFFYQYWGPMYTKQSSSSWCIRSAYICLYKELDCPYT